MGNATAYDGQDIVQLYYSALQETEIITQEEIANWVEFRTKITLVQFRSRGFQFRMETTIRTDWAPICQYVLIDCDGIIKFREDLEPWFLPGDMLFKTFGSALDFLAKRAKG